MSKPSPSPAAAWAADTPVRVFPLGALISITCLKWRFVHFGDQRSCQVIPTDQAASPLREIEAINAVPKSHPVHFKIVYSASRRVPGDLVAAGRG